MLSHTEWKRANRAKLNADPEYAAARKAREAEQARARRAAKRGEPTPPPRRTTPASKEEVLARMNEAGKRWRERHPELSRASGKKWREANPEKQRAASEDWRQRNLGYVAGKSRGRRRIALWATREGLNAFYEESKRLTAATGIEHQVDHIVPLIHPLVCGLHCEANLQVLTKAANLAKGNTFLI